MRRERRDDRFFPFMRRVHPDVWDRRWVWAFGEHGRPPFTVPLPGPGLQHIPLGRRSSCLRHRRQDAEVDGSFAPPNQGPTTDDQILMMRR